MQPIQTSLRFAASLCFAAFAVVSWGAEATNGDAMELFEKHVRPTLIDQCIRCHGPDKQQGGLRLDTARGWAEGGDSGPAIVPGEPDSLLLRAIGYDDPALEMPPRGKLPSGTIEAIRQWVTAGAVDPRTPSVATTDATPATPSVEQGRSFWSFQPIEAPKVPDVNRRDWPRRPMDHFVLARLEDQGLQPAPDADRRTLIRRLYYDLVGLPPTPAQMDAFLSSASPTAYEELVDQLLDSHHFGERWGRHWLDVVRFAQSSGGGRTLLFPDAWRYRDYVVDSFNADVPYDRFLLEQIAGDLLDSSGWQERQRHLAATAFLLLGPTNYELQDKDTLEMDIVDEQLDTVGKALMGMTIGCARCHDHKFDPIPARDYYAMAGIFKSTRSVIHSNVSAWNTVDLPLPKEEQSKFDRYEQRLADAKSRHKKAKKRWVKAGGQPDKNATAKSVDVDVLLGIVVDDASAEKIGDWTASTSVDGYVGTQYIHDAKAEKGDKRVVYRPKIETPGKYEVLASHTPAANRSSRVPIHIRHKDGETVVRVNQTERPSLDGTFSSLGVFEFDLAEPPVIIISNQDTADGVVIADTIALVDPNRDRQALVPDQDAETARGNRAQIAALKKQVDTLAAEIEAINKAAPKRPLLMAAVDESNPADVPIAIRGMAHQKGPIAPRGVMEVASWEPFPEIPAGQSGRKEFAQWVADPRHPLTARVMTNRVWYWLMGRGIVPSVDNFGSMGELPSHPMLLDHLAASFVEQGWSVKRLIREIVLSRSYRMDSWGDERSRRLDPQNRSWSRMIRKRLRAEDFRDTLLAVAGELDLTYGGANLKKGTKIEYGYEFTSTRRSIYVPVFRNTLPEIFEVFDFADPNIQRGRRSASTVASQALLLMNQPRVIQLARRAADQLLDETASMSHQQRIDYMYQQVIGRSPTERELAVAIDLVGSDGDHGLDRSAWSMMYQVLFQCIDFRYLD